jgi:sec-independent protein translocase protein TatA
MLTGIVQPTHLIIVLALALLFFGPKRLPDAGRALGQGLRELRNSLSGVHDEAPQRRVWASGVGKEEPPAASRRADG